MRLRLSICLGLLAAVAGVGPVPASAEAPFPPGGFLLSAGDPAKGAAPIGPSLAAGERFFGYSVGFSLQGTNGYSVGIYGFSERRDGRGEVFVGVTRKGRYRSGASYGAPGIVSEDFVKADLGSFGKVDLAVHPSGQTKRIDIKCSKESYPFETGEYEGVVEFEGEQGYTRVSATRIPFQPVTSFCGGGSGYGESRGPGIPGARLSGISFAHGRRLSFQVNKNHPRKGRVPFSVELGERHEGIRIHRAVRGFAGGGGFRFDPDLRSAELSLPSPFSGTATLRRRPNSVTPRWTGDLAVDFVGRPDVRLAGPGVFVSLVHACFVYSGDPSTGYSC
jgi:hypothetical protein